MFAHTIKEKMRESQGSNKAVVRPCLIPLKDCFFFFFFDDPISSVT